MKLHIAPSRQSDWGPAYRWLCSNPASAKLGVLHYEAAYGPTPHGAFRHFMERYRGWPRLHT